MNVFWLREAAGKLAWANDDHDDEEYFDYQNKLPKIIMKMILKIKIIDDHDDEQDFDSNQNHPNNLAWQ